MKEKLFHQFRPMLEQAAWKTSRKYKIDVEETRSQAYVIFCEALEKFDTERASFSTYLFHSLKKLPQYFHNEKRICDYEEMMSVEDKKYNKFILVIEELETALDLSDDAQMILEFILSREWEMPGVSKTIPRLHTTTRWFQFAHDWAPIRTRTAWKEIRLWHQECQGG